MKNLWKFYHIVIKYWYLILLGFLSSVIFSLLNGMNVVLIKPLLDFIFVKKDQQILHHTMSEFGNAILAKINEILGDGSIFDIIRDKTLSSEIFQGIGRVMMQSDSYMLLQLLCIFVFVVFLMKNIFFYIEKIFYATLRGLTIKEIRFMMFEKYLYQSLAYLGKNRIGDSLVRMVNDVQIVNRILLNSVFAIFREIITILVLIQVALHFNKRLFLISMIVIPFFTLIVGYIGKKIKKYARRLQSQSSDMFSNVEEVLNNIVIVKAFSKERFELKKLTVLINRFYKFWRKSELYKHLNTPISEMNSAIIGMIILIIGGAQVLSNSDVFTFGDFMAFLMAMFSLLHPAKNITKKYADIKKGLVSLDRVYEILDQPITITEKPNPIRIEDFNDKIVFENVNFAYEENKKVLNDINLTVRKGEKVALVGSSGSGKSTLVNLLPRLYDINSGKIMIDGNEIRDLSLSSLRELFGVVTQQSFLFSGTIKENIAYGYENEITEEKIRTAGEIAFVDEFVDNLENGYAHEVINKGSNFSGGQKQRICIARAIFHNPPILIFDEATSALDTESEQKVQSAIERATQNRTVIVIAHRLSTILSSDKIVVMDNGKILDIGTNDELLDRCERYKTLYNLQFNA